MKRTGFMAVVAAGVAMLFASSASALDKVTVAYFLEWPTANQVAQLEKTYDEAMGVEVEWRAFGNGNEMSQAMVSGDVQIAYSQGLVPWVVAVTNGLPLKLVGVAVSYAEADNCVVHADTGISQANAAELEGKTIATPIGNVTHYKLLRTLDHLGVDASKVNMVQMNGADASVRALARGRRRGLRLRRPAPADEGVRRGADDRGGAGGDRHSRLRRRVSDREFRQ